MDVDAAMDEAERLLPTLLAAGYVTVDDGSGTWAFTTTGVARAEALEGRPSDNDDITG
jgi:DNA-binding IclR family transcriptional regulator